MSPRDASSAPLGEPAPSPTTASTSASTSASTWAPPLEPPPPPPPPPVSPTIRRLSSSPAGLQADLEVQTDPNGFLWTPKAAGCRRVSSVSSVASSMCSCCSESPDGVGGAVKVLWASFERHSASQLDEQTLAANAATQPDRRHKRRRKCTKRHHKRYKNQPDQEDEDELPDPNVDGGYAWIILAVLFTINASTFGTARAYGLIFEKLARVDEQSRARAALPFTIMGAIENMGGPLTSYLLTRNCCSWRLTVFIGTGLITLAHLMAALSNELVSQTLSIGLMCGSGLSFVTISFFQINNAYFVRYRGTAFGLGLTGAAFGALYISPLCQYVLDHYSTRACYLALSVILLPNVPLSLLLKPKTPPKPTPDPEPAHEPPTEPQIKHQQQTQPQQQEQQQQCEIVSVSGDIAHRSKPVIKLPVEAGPFGKALKRVLGNPMFHLLWPTQLVFCWFNFVYGMIIVDFGKDRGMDMNRASDLVIVWALGQLVGRVVLGPLVDVRFISYRLFTVICFLIIGSSTWLLNNTRAYTELAYEDTVISMLVFVLSTAIANLYILFNSLMTYYVEKQLVALSIGISSFTGSFFLLPRAHVIGHYRDTVGNYDSMLDMFTYVASFAALSWLVIPPIIDRIQLARQVSVDQPSCAHLCGWLAGAPANQRQQACCATVHYKPDVKEQPLDNNNNNNSAIDKTQHHIPTVVVDTIVCVTDYSSSE